MENPNLALAQTGQSMLQQPLSSESRIVVALTEMALKRGAEASEKHLALYSTLLNQYPLALVLQVLKTLGETERGEGEAAFPAYGRVKLLVEEELHPLKVLRRNVRKLARIFRETPTEEMMADFELVCWHRIDADVEAAYVSLVRDRVVRKMPTPAEFLQSCGPLRKSRCPGSDKCRKCIPENDGNLCTGNCPRPAETLGRAV